MYLKSILILSSHLSVVLQVVTTLQAFPPTWVLHTPSYHPLLLQNMRLFFMQFSPASCYLLSESNYSPPHPVLKHPQSIFIPLSFLFLPLWSIEDPWNALFRFSFLILGQSAGILGRGISPSQIFLPNMKNKVSDPYRTTCIAVMYFIIMFKESRRKDKMFWNDC
jgi:hypothetical protein